jgi:hypothetical protein
VKTIGQFQAFIFGKYLNIYIEDLDGILLRILVMILAKICANLKICSEHKVRD